MKAQTNSGKNRQVRAEEKLPALIERLAESISVNRPVEWQTAEQAWTLTVTTFLRLSAIRLTHREADWEWLLQRFADFLVLSTPDSIAETGVCVSDSELTREVLELVDSIASEVEHDDERGLSSIYEAVLNMVPTLVLENDNRRVLKPKILDKSKKRAGRFYSPPHLVSLVVDNALKTLVSRASAGPEGGEPAPPSAAVLDLKIVDPAMGAGIFVVHAFRFLARAFETDNDLAQPAAGNDATFDHAAADHASFDCAASGNATFDGATASNATMNSLIARTCLYGVDLDPLAVEVARLSLWIAVGDYSLNPVQDFPNLRVGNSLIGCRTDQVDRLPQVPRNRKSARTMPCNPQHGVDGAPKEHRPFKEKSYSIISAIPGDNGSVFESVGLDLKARLDKWCASWFTDEAENKDSSSESEDVRKLASRYKFFHWQSEFPEVFDPSHRSNPGFDAVIGNPPWEIEKPNSREFFGMVEPEYWALGKQAALNAQRRLLDSDPELAAAWQSRKREHDLFSRWIKKAPVQLDAELHPFACQGSGDTNLYKLFSEQSFYLARINGTIALIVPSGIYSDCGARELRRHLLQRNNWSHLIGFENSDTAFNIHRSFKYCVFIALKGGQTSSLETSFSGQACQFNPASIALLSPKWSVLSEVENNNTLSILERIYKSSDLLGAIKCGGESLRYTRELDMTLDSQYFKGRDELEASGFVQDIYGNWLSGKWRDDAFRSPAPQNGIVRSVGGRSSISYEDIKELFVPLYEGRMVGQFTANEKHWIEGKGRRALWQKPPFTNLPQSAHHALGPQYLVHRDVFAERCDTTNLKVGFLAVGCATNARTMIATCLSGVACGNSVPVLSLSHDPGNFRQSELLRREVGARASLPASNAGENMKSCRDAKHADLPTPPVTELQQEKLSLEEFQLALCGCLNSLVFDYVIRRKMAGNNLNFFVVEECPLPKFTPENQQVLKRVARLVSHLALSHYRFCRELVRIGYSHVPLLPADRENARTVRSYIDVLVAHLYGLSFSDLQFMLTDSYLESGKAHSKGFFRIDRDLPLSERLPARVLRQARDFEETGLQSMLSNVDSFLLSLSSGIDERLEHHSSLLNLLLYGESVV